MGFEAHLKRLAEIDGLLVGDLSGRVEQARVTLLLAQFADYGLGDTLHILPVSLPAAQAFARRVMPGCQLGMCKGPHSVLLDPPRDETRLPLHEREARWVEPVTPAEGADPEAVALLKVTARVLAASVRGELASLPSKPPAPRRAPDASLPAVGSFHG
ncbi:hypothetical protein [Methylobacterium sp. J-068]|uniref:hypothetical protein n=1 Tax=Methylobacterium sp. J-068 TaxID=2836649 RepID=UPI001FBBCCAD|nr:hypothetical protein [Methylobacterium sp. J-068]MCJ2035488.1 hypothetical protein [Methylobacterium sp. J-068]